MDKLPFWLALIRTPGLGPASISALVRRFGTPQQALRLAATDAELLVRLKPETLAALRQPDWRAVERDLAWIAHSGNSVVMQHDADYPQLLRHVAGAPLALFVRGDKNALATPQIAMVGSRNPSPGGRRTATEFARGLVAHNYTITSGLALGIDAASHQGALDGGGRTIAVSATGPEQIYPSRHRALADQIVASGGAIVTEFPTGVSAAREHFPRRNRIISGMAFGTVVVEAAVKSGSLITAQYAVEQGRDVFAVPGSIYNPNSEGCHRLIKQGAKLAERADDIVEEFGFCVGAARNGSTGSTQNNIKDDELPREKDRVLQAIGYEPTSIDAVIERTAMTAEWVTSIVMELEIEGRIASMSSGMYVRQG